MLCSGITEEESDRRECIGRRCWLWYGMDSTPCWSSRTILRKGWIEEQKLGGLYALETRIIIWLTLKMNILPKTFLHVILAAKWQVRHSILFPKSAETTFAFSSVWFFSYVCHSPYVHNDGNLFCCGPCPPWIVAVRRTQQAGYQSSVGGSRADTNLP